MPLRQFRSIGLTLLESIDGDYMIASPSMKMNTIMRRRLIDGAKSDAELAGILARQFVNFLEKHREARTESMQAKIELMRKIDPQFAERMTKCLQGGNLRKVEKDFFFWERENNYALDVPIMDTANGTA